MAIVPSSALQVDIYVTSFEPIPPPLPPQHAHFERKPTKSDEELQLPHPSFIHGNFAHLRSVSTDSVESHESYESDVDFNYYLGEFPDDEPPADELRIAHETNMLDLTNFDGDVDVALPGEAYLSEKLKKEGKLRRLRSRKDSAAGGRKQNAQLSHTPTSSEVGTPRHAQDLRQAYPDRHTLPSRPSRAPQPRRILTHTQSTDRLLAISPLSERPHSSSSEADLYSPLSHRPESPFLSHSPLNSVSLSPDPPPTAPLVNVDGSPRPSGYPLNSYLVSGSEPGKSIQRPPSTTNMLLDQSYSARFSVLTMGASDSQPPFEMDEQEANDVNVVSEHARPGKPKLDRVIADEVQASKGPIVVACQSTPCFYPR